MSDSIKQTVEALSGMDDVNSVRDLAERRLTQGDAVFVADLGIALFKRFGASSNPIWQYRSVFNSVLRLLTVAAGREHMEQTLRLLAVVGEGDRKKARYLASLLGSNHSAEDLAQVFAGGLRSGGGLEELRACLVHELILRDSVIENVPAIAEWATSPHWSHHPLRWLPLRRSPVEEGHELPGYSVRGSSHSLPFGPSDEGSAVTSEKGAAPPPVREISTPETSEAIESAVTNWAEESNGRIESRSFELDGPAGSIADLLAALNLECLAGLGRKMTLSTSSCPPSRAWQVLFAAASTGGAYNQGLYGAYGRLAAWQSLRGLAGTSGGEAFADAEQRVQTSRWYTFGATTKWFEQVAWDIGITALSPDNQRLRLLAATDTD
ncbi:MULTISPECIES: DUF6183 family protein [Streptosporangium]|uniref:Uncharacterized protein n=1 Tax=Streptosporangium brasiliense TaxID=47480 RepID=A0ABT9RIX0_9ACTN|nr:DUF6183 family protein [Streptosporangium brasiliense]MDP9868654.1 hypothetical protein [Streptosporangium brasiliense]